MTLSSSQFLLGILHHHILAPSRSSLMENSSENMRCPQQDRHPVYLSTPVIFAKFFKTVPRAPIINGTSTTSTQCIRRTKKGPSWYRSIFQASVVTIFPSSGAGASTISDYCFSFKTIVTYGLLSGTRLQ